MANPVVNCNAKNFAVRLALYKIVLQCIENFFAINARNKSACTFSSRPVHIGRCMQQAFGLYRYIYSKVNMLEHIMA